MLYNFGMVCFFILKRNLGDRFFKRFSKNCSEFMTCNMIVRIINDSEFYSSGSVLLYYTSLISILEVSPRITISQLVSQMFKDDPLFFFSPPSKISTEMRWFWFTGKMEFSFRSNSFSPRVYSDYDESKTSACRRRPLLVLEYFRHCSAELGTFFDPPASKVRESSLPKADSSNVCHSRTLVQFGHALDIYYLSFRG